MHETARGILTKERHVPRWVLLSTAAALAIVLAGTALLRWMGSALPPPEFEITATGSLQPVRYPLWRRVHDWLSGRKYVFLTFDDGPYGHGIDEAILNTLAKHHAHAIFFEVCTHITKQTRNVPEKVLSGGNLLGNHSYDHSHLAHLHGESLTHEIRGCSKRIKEVSGVKPKLFRPPWGQTSPEVLHAIHAAGMQQILWNANSGDTWLKSPQQIIDMSLYEVSIGGATSILLMHSSPLTAEALDKLLTVLSEHGVRFVVPTVIQNVGPD